jgi:hypothetical protein
MSTYFNDMQVALDTHLSNLPQVPERYGLITDTSYETEVFGSITDSGTVSDYGSITEATDTIAKTDIAWPNVAFEPNDLYLRPSFLPGTTQQSSLGASGKDETIVLYQIDVVTRRNTGRSALPDTIADHFKRGTILQYAGLKMRVRSVSIGPAINERDWFFVPVTVDLQVFTGARS